MPFRPTLFVTVAVLVLAAPSLSRAEPSYTLEEGVRLGPQMQGVILRIAEAFHRRTGRRLVVTSGTRSPLEQADAMYEKLLLGQRLTSLYHDHEAAMEIQEAYRRHRRERRERCVAAMAHVIQRQLMRGRVISRHLLAGAADIRSRGLDRRERRIFEEIVAHMPGVSLLVEGAPPHFHLELVR